MNNGFKYFPEKLYSKPVKMFNGLSAVKGFGTAKPVEIFYSIKDGNWSDITTWETVSGRPGKIPTASDDVYIRNDVKVNITNAQCNNIFVKGILSWANSNNLVSVFGDIQATGIVDMTGTNSILILYGINNSVNNFISGTSGTVRYARTGVQNIMILPYHNLTTLNAGTKNINASLVVKGALLYTFLSLNNSDLTVNGTSAIVTQPARFDIVASPDNTINFVGQLSNFGGTAFMTISGNPIINFYGGYSLFNAVNFLDSRVNFYGTNIALSNTASVFNGFTIQDNSVLSGQGISTNGVIDGTNAGSKFINKGDLYFNNSASTVLMPTVGTFDIATFVNTVFYRFNGNFTLNYTAFYNLYLSLSTGAKTLGGNTTCAGFMTLQANLDLAGFNLGVTGDLTNSQITLNSSGNGNLSVNKFNANQNSSTVDFNGAVRNVEIRGGLYTGFGNIDFGGNLITFSTNNQVISHSFALPFNFPFNVLVSGAITLTAFNNSTGYKPILSALNGNNAFSKFVNQITIQYTGTAQPMLTGILDCSTNANIFIYDFAGNQDVTGSTYRTLEFGGSGVKRLMGNVVVNTTAGGSWSITGSATIDYNGFTITTI